MGISFDEPEESVDSDGTLLVLLIPAGGIANLDAPKVSELSAPTAIDATYGFTADGWNHAASEDERDDDRLTLKQAIRKAGRQTDTLSTKHVFGSEDAVVDGAIVRGEKYVFAVRYAVDHDTPIAAGQLFDILPVVAGRPGKDAPVANGRWTKTTNWRPFDDVRDDVAAVTA